MAPAQLPVVEVEPFDDATVYVLREPTTGSEARVLPEVGNNVVSFRTAARGRVVDVIVRPPPVSVVREHPSRYGAAVLFPFPGRLANGAFSFAGRDYKIPPTPGLGSAMHGTVRQRPWTVLGATADPEVGASVRCAIDCATDADILTYWPFPFRLNEEVGLRAGELTLSFAVENTGDSPMPMGLGLHPYFSAPLGPLGTRDDCAISVTAERYWEQEAGLPTGVTRPVSEAIDLRHPRMIRDIPHREIPGRGKGLNLLYSAFESPKGLPPEAPGGIVGCVRDEMNGLEVRMKTSAGFGAMVVFESPWSSSMSLEPHTCVPNALNLCTEGLNPGVVVLRPGEVWRGWVSIAVVALRQQHE